MQVVLGGNGIYLGGVYSPTPSVDPDAQAFITAASITDPTQQTAINQLVTDLKGYGIWTKMKALYPFVGGTASSHKFNLKDPRDLDAAYRLVFFGGITHDSNGVTGNATNSYVNTNFKANSAGITLGNYGFGFYSNTNAQEIKYQMGVRDSVNVARHSILSRNTSNIGFASIQSTTEDSFGSVTNSSGNVSLNYISGSRKVNIQGLSYNLISTNSTPHTTDMYLMALNNSGTASFFSGYRFSLFRIHEGLNSIEENNMQTLITTFQTALNRQV